MTKERFETLVDLALYIHSYQTATVLMKEKPPKLHYTVPRRMEAACQDLQRVALGCQRDLIETAIEELLQTLAKQKETNATDQTEA